MIAAILIILLLVVLAVAPGLWVRRVMARYHRPENRYPGTGGELAEHLLRRLELDHVRVEESTAGDHYDPLERAVRLSPRNFRGRSLTAVTVAAHEVGHAVQDAFGYAPLHWRLRLVKLSRYAQILGAGLLIAMPVIVAVTRAPAAGGILMVAVLLSMGSAVLVHLITLPTELDASFRRALPLLEAGYLKPGDEPHARRILLAAALTYVAAALMGLFSVWAWLRLLRPG
ncbi:MAG: zinc metallopeptidase [Ectothiorhodospiraceae bacterium]|nr:zinc metallopeptidase [Ectothiorhodospiraceae bacterium]